MPLTGDFSGLARASADISALAGKVQRIGAVAAPKIQKLVQKEFQAGTDPSGAAWAALAASTLKKGRFAPPLTDSGKMAGTANVAAQGLAIRATVDGPSSLHQGGTGSMPARPILPSGELPAAWDDAITAAARTVLGKAAVP